VVTFSKNLHINLLLFILLSIIFIVVSCGGSDNTFISTNPVTDNPSSFINTPTPALTSKPVNAYVYISNTSLEDGENIENINTLEIPAVNPDSSDSTPLLTQISNLQKENPDDWNSTDIKELCNKLGTTLKQSIALPETAKVFTVYQDSLCSSPIPVLNGGYISGQAVVGDTDTNVQLEISLNDDNYFEAETIISSDNLTSKDAIGVTLKSCPEKIVVLPGEVIMYQVYSTTGINLKEAGLTFSIKNSNLGCITTKPLFLEICGKKKYDKAYGFFYPKKSLTTPIDTVITAKTTSGLQLDIFTEIIKSTASISGKVFTGGKPFIKGYVKSIGPKAFCKIDSSGNYTLPRVFRGHFRKIIATYWIEENGKKIRHREEKIIDFFNSDVSNFNFGEELITPTPVLTPTPTSTPLSLYDTFYDEKVTKVLRQFNQWQLDLGTELAAQKTVNWLNGGISEIPIPEEIVEAKLDPDNHTDIWIYFTDGHKIALVNRPYFYKEIQGVSIKGKESKLKSENLIFSNVNQKAGTVGSTRILILAPLMWDERRTIRNLSNTEIGNNRVYFKIAEDLIAIKDDDNQSVYPVDRIITEESTFFTILLCIGKYNNFV